MKSLIFSLILISQLSYGCVAPAEKIYFSSNSASDFGFNVDSESSGGCRGCREISISGPPKYKNVSVSHYISSVYLKGVLSSRIYHAPIIESGSSKFTGIFNDLVGYNYEIEFNYGEGRCVKYQLIFKGGANAL